MIGKASDPIPSTTRKGSRGFMRIKDEGDDLITVAQLPQKCARMEQDTVSKCRTTKKTNTVKYRK